MLELRGVTKLYSGIPAVKDIGFTARGGEVTGYLGPNGSGKSTTLKMIAGLIEPTEGEILFRGEPIDGDRIAHRQRLGYVPEEAHVYPHLTGTEYLEMIGHLRGLPERKVLEKVDGLLRLFSLHEDRWVPISSYSKGMRQKILLAAALLHNPDLILLDEPMSGLDLNSALIVRRLVQSLAAKGKTVLFSAHEIETVERLASQVVILHKGRVAAAGSTAELRALLSAQSLEDVFQRLAVEQDSAAISGEIIEIIES